MARFEELACQYLASIPRQDSPPVRDIGSLKQLPIDFVKSPVRAAVKVDMVEPVAHVQITFPVEVRSAPSALPSPHSWTSQVCALHTSSVHVMCMLCTAISIANAYYLRAKRQYSAHVWARGHASKLGPYSASALIADNASLPRHALFKADQSAHRCPVLEQAHAVASDGARR